MIYHIKGNLLTSDCSFLIHQSNCQGGFGSGIAGQIRTLFPKAYEVFKNDNRSPEAKLGKICYAVVAPGKVVVNLYGQFNYGRDKDVQYTDYIAFKSGLDMSLTVIKNIQKDIHFPNNKIGMPYLIGCGLANGNWAIVSKIIEQMADKHGVDIYLYEYTP